MRPVGAPGRRDDDRQRGADSKLHAHRVGHLVHAEQFEENRHDHRTAANSEETRKNAGDDAGGDDRRGELGQLGDRNRAQRFGLATIWVRNVPIAGERMSTLSPGFR